MTNQLVFSSDLFSRAIATWMTHVFPRFAGVPNVKWLEVGSHEGRSALWTLEKVLTGTGSSITCLDLWGSWTPNYDLPWKAARLADRSPCDWFDFNLVGRSNVVKLKGKSADLLPTLPRRHFHGAYIDGSHEFEDVYSDACLTLPLLRDEALLIFDDYEGNLKPEKREFGVNRAVSKFLSEHPNEFEVLHEDYQIVLLSKGK